MSLGRRAIERPRLTAAFAIVAAAALLGAGAIGAALAGGGDRSDEAAEAAARADDAEGRAAELEQHAAELEIQLEAALRRIRDLRAAGAERRLGEDRGATTSRPNRGSRGESPP